MIFLFLYHLKIGASWLVNGFVQAGIFGKVAFFIIFMVYFNILKSKVLVHWIDPTARFGRGVNSCCHWWHFSSPPTRRVQHFSIEKVMQNRYKKSYTDILLTCIACSFHWFPIVILPRAHSLWEKSQKN